MKRGSFRKLEYLWLNNCGKIGRDIEFMKQFIKSCRNLKFLSLEYVIKVTELKEEILEDLKASSVNGKLQIVIGKYFHYSAYSKYLTQKYNQDVIEDTLGFDCMH